MRAEKSFSESNLVTKTKKRKERDEKREEEKKKSPVKRRKLSQSDGGPRYLTRSKGEVSKKALDHYTNYTTPDKRKTSANAGFHHRFEKSPKEIAVMNKQLDGSSAPSNLEKFTLFADCLKNPTAGTPPRAGKTPEYCRDNAGAKMPKLTSVRISSNCMVSQKILFFATTISPSKKRHYTGLAIDDKSLEELIKEIDELIVENTSKGEANQKQKNNTQDLPEWWKKVPTLIQQDKKIASAINITRTLLNKWDRATVGKRKKTQLSVMGVSAGDYVEFYGFDNPTEFRKSTWEWSHLVAHSFGGLDGKDPQHPKNLVATTTGCNTWMMLAEATIRYILTHYKKDISEITLSCEAELIAGTHIASKICYKIAWKYEGVQKEIRFKFRGLHYDAPPRALEKYLFALVDAQMKSSSTSAELEQESMIEQSSVQEDETMPLNWCEC